MAGGIFTGIEAVCVEDDFCNVSNCALISSADIEAFGSFNLFMSLRMEGGEVELFPVVLVVDVVI